ncbi:gas vesicle protein [Streptomyces sp. SP17BM10]|uniref:gas vesicle protein GvpO n=1 Tax=Streptomyces sp. SP17BM10 TaxID=3002530 RepID=UPI002E78E14E|nr:gas vesicle protein GvpO [Streptomyces sp. SP17BM10]MEE1787066.1 gas vesicle protein [Streptomyces sp. SP17BM10]
MPEPEPRARRPADRATAPRRRTAAADGEHREPASGRSRHAPAEPDRTDPPKRTRTPLSARQVAARAARQVQELTGNPPEGVTSLERDGEGWRIGIEVLESRRVPDSTDILAVYQVVLDERGGLVSYHRERRYHRGHVDPGETP